MKGTLQPKVKICCISSIEEAEMAIQHGADHLGLVGHMPSGPGIISDALIKEIANSISIPTSSFLLTSETDSAKIIAHHKKVKTSTIQIVDALQTGTYEMMRQHCPDVKLVQVIHVINEASIIEAKHVSQFVDFILLDSGNPNLKIKVLGGTGNVHDWQLSKKIREAIDIPVYLAGGLNSENVTAAIQQVQPYGVDLCSGVRSNGKLDPVKLKAFFEAVKCANLA